MPAQLVVTKRPGLAGKTIEEREPLGGVFGPVPKQQLLRPAYTWGPKESAARDQHLFQCPVSAIPDEVWILLHLWHDCRLLRVLPPLTPLLRRAFVVFEAEMQAIDRRSASGAPERAAAMAVGAMFKVMNAGGR